MIIWGLLVGALIVLYVNWYLVMSIWSRLGELGVEHERTFVSFFDGVLKSGLIALAAARLTWMFLNLSVFADVPWGIVPYIRSASGISWFSIFPWRFLLFSEGVVYSVLWSAFGLCAALMLYVPTFVLINRLKIDKKRVKAQFRWNAAIGVALTMLYAALVVYFSL